MFRGRTLLVEVNHERARYSILRGDQLELTHHGETITGCHFEYGPDTNYGSAKPCASTPSGSGPSPVSAALTGLTPGAVYQVTGTNTAGPPFVTADAGGRLHFDVDLGPSHETQQYVFGPQAEAGFTHAQIRIRAH